jgi:hypothetical protein
MMRGPSADMAVGDIDNGSRMALWHGAFTNIEIIDSGTLAVPAVLYEQ